jgi:uncharacterized membrane protein
MIVASIVIIAVGVLMFTLLRTSDHAPAHQRHRDDPARDRALWVARERLTAGDIDAEQYERIVHALSR